MPYLPRNALKFCNTSAADNDRLYILRLEKADDARSVLPIVPKLYAVAVSIPKPAKFIVFACATPLTYIDTVVPLYNSEYILKLLPGFKDAEFISVYDPLYNEALNVADVVLP